MKRIRKRAVPRLLGRLRENRGATLTELLMAVVVIVILSGILITGTGLAVKSYTDVTAGANAEVLLSTTVNTLRTQLLGASGLSVSEDGKTISYRKNALGMDGSIRSGTEEDAEDGAPETIYITEYGRERPLISDAASTEILRVEFDSASYDGDAGLLTFNGLRVIRIADGRQAAGIETFAVGCTE